MSNILINIVQRRRYKIWLFGLAFGFAMFFIMFAVHTKVAAVSTCSWPGQGCGFFYGYEWPPNPNYQDGFELLNTFAQPEPANIAGNFPSYCGQQIQGAVIPQSCNGTPISKSLELQIFISDVEDNLYFGTSSNPWPQADQPLSAYDCDLQNNAQTGAAFIILSMLGLPSSDGLATNNNPNTCNPNASQAIVSVSTTYVTQWANIVTEYANGVDGFSINWNESYNSNYQTFFTGYDTGNESWHDSDWFNSPTDDPSIVFLNPSGQTVFSIDQTCGNLNYDPAALPVPSGNTPSGSFSASCSLMSGTAMDQNDPGASQGITISINGPLAPGATIQNFSTTPNATDSTWTINPASLTAPASFDGPSPPPAGWVLPSYIKSNKPFDIFVYVYGINSSGAPDGTYYYAGDQSIGPCPPQPSWTVSASASCSTLSFSFKGSPDLAKLQATGPGGAVLTYSPPIKKFPDKPSSKTFTASISNYQSGYSNTFVVQATDTSGSTGTSIASSGPCVVASITSVSASCAGPAGDVQATIDISDNIGSPGPTVYWQIDSGSTTIDNHPSGLSPSWFVDIPLPTTTASIGPHTFYAWFFSGSTKVAGSANFNCDTFPYFQVQGGDISTGSTPACITDPESNPGVYGPDGASPTIGSQLAIYALGVISGYASDQQGVTDGNTNLDFANNGPNTPGTFGTVPCMPNDQVPSTCTTTGIANLDPTMVASGTCFNSDSTTTGSSPTIGNGVTKTIYIKGNLIISSNITYASNWTTPSDIPSLTFVVAGNIYINPSVTQLYGNYFSTGTVYTCTDSTTGAGIYATGAACGMGNSGSSTQLQFYGSLMAKQIAFERTYGAVNTNGPVANSPAEVYNYSPAEWLGGYGTGNLGNNYGSITNLPPLL